MDSTIVNIIGYNLGTGELYGIARDRLSFVLSEDSGATWVSIPRARYDLAAAESGFVRDTVVEWYTSARLAGLAPMGSWQGMWK